MHAAHEISNRLFVEISEGTVLAYVKDDTKINLK
jgi:hypothetical protein